MLHFALKKGWIQVQGLMKNHEAMNNSSIANWVRAKEYRKIGSENPFPLVVKSQAGLPKGPGYIW